MTDAESAVDPLPGSVFQERYRIDRKLGAGGMGSVYLGEQLSVGRKVAIKIMLAGRDADLKGVARFQQEARAAARLRHGNIVQLIDFGQTVDHRLFLVMEHVDGSSLAELIDDEAPLAPERIIDIGLQALDALSEAHAARIIHRDLKPPNLMIALDRRGRDLVKVLDFGIAKVHGEGAAAMTLTQAGVAIGSPQYMPPEQARGQAVSVRSDLYSLGCILYEMLTGELPFDGEGATDFMMAHVTETPKPPMVDGEEVTGPLVALIGHCLAKREQDRPVSADEAHRRLEACRGGAVRPGPAGGIFGGTASVDGGPTRPEATLEEDTIHRPAVEDGRDTTPSVVASMAGSSSAPSAILVVGLVAFLLLVGGGVASWLVMSSSQDEQAEPAEPQVVEALADPADLVAVKTIEATVVVTPPPAAAPAPRIVHLTSEPVGAKVSRGDELLGVTPIDVEWAPGEEAPGELTLAHEAAGKVWSGSIALREDHAGQTIAVQLVGVAPPEVEPEPEPRPKAKAKAKAKARKKKPAADDSARPYKVME